MVGDSIFIYNYWESPTGKSLQQVVKGEGAKKFQRVVKGGGAKIFQSLIFENLWVK